jgi:AraC-like DNA-binding protein
MVYKTFCFETAVDYRERGGDAVFVNKYYEFRPAGRYARFVIPDGCVDIQFVSVDGETEVYLMGSPMSRRAPILRGFDFLFGVKLNPGVIPACFKCCVQDVTDGGKPIGSFEELRDLKRRFMKCGAFDERADLVSEWLPTIEMSEIHYVTEYILDEMDKNNLNSVDKLVRRVGYSHQHVGNIFKQSTGFTVKKFADIVRFQKTLDFLERSDDEMYNALGYYDQSHAIHEFKKYTSYTPGFYKIHMDVMKIV